MRPAQHSDHVFQHLTWTAATVISLALLLHPMDPLNFLALALFDPLQTISESYGIQAAILFWSGTLLLAFDLLLLIRKIMPRTQHDAGALRVQQQ